MKGRRMICLLLVMVIFTLVGCKGNTPSTSEVESSNTTKPSSTTTAKESEDPTGLGLSDPGEFPIVKGDVTLEIVAPDAAYLSDFNDNEFTKWYEEYTGVKVKWKHASAATKAEEINLMLVSNSYPDIIISPGIGTAGEITYGTQGYFLDLTDMIEEHGFYFKDVIKENSNLPAAIKSPDGAIYALPNINDCFHCNNTTRAFINNLWLENVGMKYPETTEEFYQVLKAFKEQDANGNGNRNDEIPMMGANKGTMHVYQFLLNSFLYFDPSNSFLALNNGTTEFVGIQDDYKEGLLYIRRLFEEGLIDVSSLTQTEETFKQIGTNPDAHLIGVGTTALWWKFLGYYTDTADQRANDYLALAPLKGPKGIRYSPTTGTAVSNTAAIITDKCKNPEVAMKWLDGLYSQEVTIRSQRGVEGENWEYAANGLLGIHGKPATLTKLDTDSEDYIYKTARNTVPANRTSDFRLGESVDPNNEMIRFEQEPRLYNITAESYFPYSDLTKYLPSNLYYKADESTEYSRLKTQIETYATESLVAFLVGHKSIEKDWDSYIAEFDKLELPSYLKLVQSAYERQYK